MGAAENRLEGLYQAHAASGIRIARLLGASEPTRTTNAAFVKTISTFRDLRSPLTFDAALRRAIIKECRPSAARRLIVAARAGSAVPEHEDLWSRFRQLSHRRKAALILRYFESMSDDQVADVLGCSTGTVRVLINRGLSAVQDPSQDQADPSRVAGELQRLFASRAEGSPVILDPDRSVVDRALLGRRISMVAAVVVTAAAVAAGALAVRASNTPDQAAPPPPATDQQSPETIRSLTDEDLRPDARLQEQAQVNKIVASGTVDGDVWHLLAERGPDDQICLILRVGFSFARSHCESRALSVLHGFVDADDDKTFIVGYALEEVERVTLEVDEDKTIPVDLVEGPGSLPRRLQRQFFVIVLPDELVPLSSPEEGGDQGLRVIRTVLQGVDAKGVATQHQPLYLGR